MKINTTSLFILCISIFSLLKADCGFKQAIRNSDLFALRSLMAPGFDIPTERKAELLELAREVTQQTHMDLHKASFADTWRYVKGTVKIVAGVVSALFAYRLYQAFNQNTQPRQEKVPEYQQEGLIGQSSPLIQEEPSLSWEDVKAYGKALVEFLSPRLIQTTDEEKASAAYMKAQRGIFKAGSAASAVLAPYLIYKGAQDWWLAMKKEFRQRRHTNALAVEALMHRYAQPNFGFSMSEQKLVDDYDGVD